MKFSAVREELLDHIKTAAAVVARKPLLPVAANLLIEAEGNRIGFHGTDLEVVVDVSCETVNVEREGKATIPARKLYDIWSGLPPGVTIDVDVEDGKATIRCGRSRYALATCPVEDFPTQDSGSVLRQGDVSSATMRIPSPDVKNVVERTRSAMAVNDVRYFLNGSCFEASPQGIRVAASDGHRMSISNVVGDVAFADDVGDALRAIVPRRAVLMFERLCAGSPTETALVELGKSRARITLESVSITTQLVAGEYPDIDKIADVAVEKTVGIDRANLIAAVERTTVVADDGRQIVGLAFGGDSTVTISASNASGEEGEDRIDSVYDGEPFSVSFNAGYLLDTLKSIFSTRMRMGFTADRRMAVLTSDPDSDMDVHLLMPVRD